MKYLVLCEGTNEKQILDLLLDNNKLIFKRYDLINLEIFHARQIVPNIESHIRAYNKSDIKIIRIGDKFSDTLKIPESINHLIKKENINNYLTRPELEMLLIINKSLVKEYNKVKSKTKPKIFAKENININGYFYDCSCDFWYQFYHSNIKALIADIKDCKKIVKVVNKKDKYLADLLKEKVSDKR